MKKVIIFSFLAALMVLSCRKDDNPRIPDLTRVPTPLIKKDATGDQTISAQDPGSFKGKFTVDLYFKSDVKPQKFDVVIIKNGNKANVKTFKSDVTTFPTTFEITGAQLATLFGTPAVLNDKFDIGVDITTESGQKFEAFPAIANAFGAGVGNQLNASTTVRFEAVCKYNSAVYQGNFVVVEDVWEDYHAGDVVAITKIDDTHFSFNHVAAVGAVPIIITVNPNDNTAKITKQSVGTQWAYGAVYVEPFVVTAGSASSSFVAPCEQTVTLNIDYGYKAGTFGGGPYRLVLKKQ